MNWTKIFIGGGLGGVAVWLYSFLMHGVIQAGTYTDHPACFSLLLGLVLGSD